MKGNYKNTESLMKMAPDMENTPSRPYKVQQYSNDGLNSMSHINFINTSSLATKKLFK